MAFETQVLFFFSALGAFNGLFLSAYFAFFVKHRNRESYFLAGLLLAVSVRVTKSVFLTFDPNISNTFIQIGLGACALIGPCLYLYTRESLKPKENPSWNWLLHILPVVIIMFLLGYFFPYRENYMMWQRSGGGPFGWILYGQWFVYILFSFLLCRKTFACLFKKGEKLSDKEIWIISLVCGIFIIWLFYNLVPYTSYVFGAISFSFVFYLLLLLWIFKRRNNTSFLVQQVKYANKKIEEKEAKSIAGKLDILFQTEALYKNPELKLPQLAARLDIAPHLLSQYLNDNLGKSFSNFINEYRIQAAEEMLKHEHHLTLEAIGQECGFKSNSSFYTAFKKFKGQTPAKFKKSLV
ncbi:MAG: helix-turn-helix domain-containing protein [Bacteroidia bacterium]|nr:helix-turn-helix domain-containing protein [Bacteroidia bacterium]